MEFVRTKNAPASPGPYEQAVIHNGLVYTAMQLPLRADGDNTALLSIEEQAELVLGNIEAILKASGSALDKILRVTIYVRDENAGKRVNAVYEKYFTVHKPARSMVGVTFLPLGYGVAMDAIAARE